MIEKITSERCPYHLLEKENLRTQKNCIWYKNNCSIPNCPYSKESENQLSQLINKSHQNENLTGRVVG